MLTPSLGIFGYLEVLYNYRQYKYKETTAGTVTRDDVNSYHYIYTQTSYLGVVFYLN